MDFVVLSDSSHIVLLLSKDLSVAGFGLYHTSYLSVPPRHTHQTQKSKSQKKKKKKNEFQNTHVWPFLLMTFSCLVYPGRRVGLMTFPNMDLGADSSLSRYGRQTNVPYPQLTQDTQIWPCAKWTSNAHYDRTYKNIGISKFENT